MAAPSTLLIDRFATPDDASFIEVVSHPVATHAPTPQGDFGGLLQRLVLFDYRERMPNPVTRGYEILLTPTADYVPNVDARFLFALLLWKENSVQKLVTDELQEAGDEKRLKFFREHYLYYLRQNMIRMFESHFDDRNAELMIDVMVTKFQATWQDQDLAEITISRRSWRQRDEADSKKVRRSHAERTTEKKRTNNQRSQDTQAFYTRLLSGEPEYWKIPKVKKQR